MTRTYLTQINATDNGNWTPVIAEDQYKAAEKALNLTGKPAAELLPCTVYVEIAPWVRHDNGAPAVVSALQIAAV
jgi:hypothetical protein